MNKINILQLITGLGMGGAEKVVFDLAYFSNKNKFNTYVVSLSKKVERLEEFQKNNINVKVLYKDNSLKNMYEIIKELSDFITENKIDVIHAHMSHSMIIATVLKLFNPKIKIISTSHNIDIESKPREVFLFLTRFLRANDILFSKDILKYFYRNDYSIIPNGIYIENYDLNISKYNKFTFISVGRLETVKNHKFLIELARNLKNRFNFEIHIVGDGYLKKDLEVLIEKYDLKDAVKLLGLRRDIPELINKSHCFLMPSLWEGLPIVLLEAAASKVPIISTPVGSIPILLDNENSYLVDLNDFEKTMVNVYNNYEESKIKVDRLFKKLSDEYSITNIVKMHEELYESVVN